jgi:hypothetical protein
MSYILRKERVKVDKRSDDKSNGERWIYSPLFNPHIQS